MLQYSEHKEELEYLTISLALLCVSFVSLFHTRIVYHNYFSIVKIVVVQRYCYVYARVCIVHYHHIPASIFR